MSVDAATEGDGVTRPQSEDLAVLLKVSTQLASSLDLDIVLQMAIESAVEVLRLETGAIYVVEGPMLRLGATTPPLPPDFPDELRLAAVVDHPHIGECLSSAGPVSIEDAPVADLSPAERAAAEARGLRSILYVPLMFRAEPVGVVIVGSRSLVRPFGGSDVDLCRTLSYVIAMSVGNAKLYAEVQRAGAELESAYEATLKGWSLAMEMRDGEVAGHTARMADLTVEIARSAGVDEKHLPFVRWGVLLHDIGKMVVPDEVLQKPGPLAEDEWVLVRAHPEAACGLLGAVEKLGPALDIPYSHHERWDGSGYPQGLAGEDIPLPARVFAVVDVYFALTSERPYRPAWSRDEALEHIRAGAGTHFDPRVVDAFLAASRTI